MVRDMSLDAEYYISKTLIPPLERIFNLVGANVRSWYDDMPKVIGRNQIELFNVRDLNRRQTSATLHSFLKSRLCTICKEEEADEGLPLRLCPLTNVVEICRSCIASTSESLFTLSSRSRDIEQQHLQLQAICSNCCAITLGDEVGCDSRDCPVFYSRIKAFSRLEHSLTRHPQLIATIEEWDANE